MYAGTTVLPSHIEYKFDVPPESRVRVTLLNGSVFQGIVDRNPSNDSCPYLITLIRCQGMEPDKKSQIRKDARKLSSKLTDKQTKTNGRTDKMCDSKPKRCWNLNVQRFFMNEIKEVRVFGPRYWRNLSKFHLPSDVRIINDKDDFRMKMYALNEEETLGFNMFGDGIGRNAEIGWVCFYTKGVMMAVDVLTLSEEMTPNALWGVLKVILESGVVRKIVHDNRLLIKYLKKTKHIVLQNYDDLSALDLSIRANKFHALSKEFTSDQFVWRPLSALLKTYLPKQFNVDEQELLKTFELGQIDSARFLKRPFPVDECAKIMVVSLKYIVDLQRKMVAVRSQVSTQLHKDEFQAVLESGILATLESMRSTEKVTDALKKLLLDATRKTI